MLPVKIKNAVFIFAAAAMLLTSCSDESQARESYEVKVILRESEGISIDGDNITEVKAGRNVTFKVTINDGYVYIGNTAGAEFDSESGRLRLHDVTAPATIDIIAVKAEDVIKFNLENKRQSCRVSINGESGGEKLLGYPGEITVEAEETSTLKFAGWSEGGYIEDGGKIISTEPVFTVYADKSMTVYANYEGYSEYEILYHLNGGHLAGSGRDSYPVMGAYKDNYAMQQTMHSNGTFVRDGYVAVGYSAEPCEYGDFNSANDIPGFANMGGVTKVDGKSLDMFVVWAKESEKADFTYEKKKISYVADSSYAFGSLNKTEKQIDGVEITGYTGKDSLAVIPEYIDGLPVTAISKDAFKGELERVVIPRTVKNIADGAFTGCDNLREVVFFDSVVSVSDKSFGRSVETVVLNAQRLPVYSGAVEGSFCIKYERLRQLTGKKIIVVSGSSSLNGIDSELFEELMPGYSVVNYGTNIANPSTFFLDVISNYVSEGDIVVHAPEFVSSSVMGSRDFHAKMFRGNEQCYDIFREVDMSQYDDFWDSFCEFQVGDRKDGSLVPAVHQTGLNIRVIPL